jgi:hypothetical protein
VVPPQLRRRTWRGIGSLARQVTVAGRQDLLEKLSAFSFQLDARLKLSYGKLIAEG